MVLKTLLTAKSRMYKQISQRICSVESISCTSGDSYVYTQVPSSFVPVSSFISLEKVMLLVHGDVHEKIALDNYTSNYLQGF